MLDLGHFARFGRVMATATATAAARPRRRVRPDDLFFLGMAVVSLVVVLIGFARTYFLAGWLRAPLPNLLLHIHGAAFTLWILLFLSQIGLVTSKRLAVHRRIGLFGFALAVVMVVLGVLAAGDQMTRHLREPGTDTLEDVRAFYAVPLSGMVMFATFIALGYRYRGNPAVHKRLMLFATFALLKAAFDRWPLLLTSPLWLVDLLTYGPLLLLTMAYDWWSSGKALKVTLFSSAFLVTILQISQHIGYTGPWQRLAAWVAAHSFAFH
jgi:hypothetical protein